MLFVKHHLLHKSQVLYFIPFCFVKVTPLTLISFFFPPWKHLYFFNDSNTIESYIHTNSPKAKTYFREVHTLHRRWDSMNSWASLLAYNYSLSAILVSSFPVPTQILISLGNSKSQVAHPFMCRCLSMYVSLIGDAYVSITTALS